MFFQERQRQTAIANEKKLVEQTIARLERDSPFINPNSPQYRQDVVDHINSLIDRLTKQETAKPSGNRTWHK